MADTYKNFINGQWVSGVEEVPNVNPSDVTEILGVSSCADENVARAAAADAKQAQKKWAAMGIEARSDVLMKIGNELVARKDELGALLSREEGKTKKEGVGEVDRAGRFFWYFAAEALRQKGDFAESVRPGIEVQVSREPVGNVLIITPWNFPTALPGWKIAPALAFGNSVVFKPALLTPASAVALVDVIHRAGVPEGVVQLLLGSGKSVGNALLTSDDVDAVSFTGSLPTGRVVATESSVRLRRFQLEMGSKNALVVLDDCDVDQAVACAVNGAFFGTGQKCTASSRLIVTKGIYQSFLEKLIAETAKIKVGHAMSPDSTIGPCVSRDQLEQNQRYLKIATDEGAKIAFQGNLDGIEHQGYYFAPVILTETSNDMKVNRDEVFGPLTALIPANDYEEALSLCNDTAFGLTAGIMTSSLKHSTDFKRKAQAGCVMVNLPTAGTDYHVPFGGTKQSSFGPREQGGYAVEFYTKVKTSYLKS